MEVSIITPLVIIAFMFLYDADDITIIAVSTEQTTNINAFLSQVIQEYRLLRKNHLKRYHWKTDGIFRRAMGDYKTFDRLLYADSELSHKLGEVIKEASQKHFISEDSVDEIIERLKQHASLLSERNEVLKLFAAILAIFFSMKDIRFFKMLFEMIWFKVYLCGLGFLALLERENLIKNEAIYEELASAMKNSKRRGDFHN